MSDTSIILLLGFIGSLICVITPILKLNASITKLNNHELRIDRLEHK